MRKFLGLFLGCCAWLNTAVCFAVDKFDILPDLPDPILKAEASTVSGTSTLLGTQSVGHEPSIISVVLSLLFVILLIYVTGIVYAKLNKLGFNTMKKQQGDLSKSRVAVVSTTQLGGSKSLHVVELDGKRMLIGASTGTIQLIKDLGNVNQEESNEEYSHIEIPNIKIPKIEIPKIEIPSINFSKLMTKAHKGITDIIDDGSVASADEVTTEAEHPEGIIDSLFEQKNEEPEEPFQSNEHMVDPEEFALYKKYLGDN